VANDPLPDNQRIWSEGACPALTVTLLDGAGNPIPLAAVVSLTLTQWIETVPPGRPGSVAVSINGRNSQNAKNANGITVAATSGVVTWQLASADTAMLSADPTVPEEKHFFRFDLTYATTSGTLAASSTPGEGNDFYIVQRKRAVQ
jgi:hypothetical protein